MTTPTKLLIGLVGDMDPSILAHVCIPTALARAASELGSEITVQAQWIPTTSLEVSPDKVLQPFHGIWCVPGSPYASMEGALAAIRHAREKQVPFLGTCGGFQHAIIEYLRNHLGVKEADHEESNPAASLPVIHRLSCSLSDRTEVIRTLPGTRLAKFYQSGGTRGDEHTEAFNCNYGVNTVLIQHTALFELEKSGLRECATSPTHEVRAVEIPGHPFFIATLFQPERSVLNKANAAVSHPVIRNFVQACSGRA